MRAVAEPIEMRPAEPDLIDRIASALPEQVRAEYYRELRHCRSLPESDEMLRLLRAMQFLVLLIEQAPSRVAEERERLDKLLTAAVGNLTKMGAASETYHKALQYRLSELPGDIAYGIRPEAIAAKINEDLREAFLRSTIPQTADALGVIADHMRHVSSEFATTADSLGNSYRGAAKDAREAVASLKSEISQATENAARFTSQISTTFAKTYNGVLFMIAGGALILGLGIGMTLEHVLLSSQEPVVQPAAQPVQPASHPVEDAPAVSKAGSRK